MSWSLTFKSLLDSAVYGQARPSFIVTSGLHCKLTKEFNYFNYCPRTLVKQNTTLANATKQSCAQPTINHTGSTHSRQSKLRLLIYHNTTTDYLMLSHCYYKQDRITHTHNKQTHNNPTEQGWSGLSWKTSRCLQLLVIMYCELIKVSS